MIGIYSKNRTEWFLIDIALWMNSVTNIPFYDTLGEGSFEFIFNQTNIRTLSLSN